MSFFKQVPLAPPDPILGLTQAFAKDTRPHKINLGVGLFRDESLKTPILDSVKQAEEILFKAQQHKEYLPIDGDALYLEEMGSLVFGKEAWPCSKERIAPFETLGGTGALKLGGTFLQEDLKLPVWIPSLTWPNHRGVFLSCGAQVSTYPYYDAKTKQVDFKALLSCIDTLPAKSVVLMQSCCHNPTGVDLTLPQWQELCVVFKKRQLLAFFDLAYQGLGDGLHADAAAVRYFLKEGVEMLVAVSNSKNLSLYSERVGCLFVVSCDATYKAPLLSRIKQLIRTQYSNPPSHGAKVAALVLHEPTLRALWEIELSEMRSRLNEMRSLLCNRLLKKQTKTDFSHLAWGKGMFGFLGLKADQVEALISDYGIYMPSDGRINVCGLNLTNIDLVVEAIYQVDA